MPIIKIIRTTYIALSAYFVVLILTTTLTLSELFPAFLLMWINFFFFVVGYGSKFSKSTSSPFFYQPDSRKKLKIIEVVLMFLWAFIICIFSLKATRFYTGQTFFVIINNILSGVSVYQTYQNFFRDAGLSSFSVSKAPFIIMLFFLKITFLYSYVVFFYFKDKVFFVEKIYLVLITAAFLYFGLARGTNYELFEFFLLIAFIVYSKRNTKNTVTSNALLCLFSILLVVIFLSIFMKVFFARKVVLSYSITNDINYNIDDNIFGFPSLLSSVIIALFGYFGFGIFYLSKYIECLWLSSLSNFVKGMVPFGFQIFQGKSIQDSMHDLIDMGPRWHPDSAVFINNWGYLGLLGICFCLGAFTKYIYSKNKITPMDVIGVFFIFVQMISLPIGNLLLTSSANKIIIMLIALYLIFNKNRKRAQ